VHRSQDLRDSSLTGSIAAAAIFGTALLLSAVHAAAGGKP